MYMYRLMFEILWWKVWSEVELCEEIIKCIIQKKIQDFGAFSLYPSAIYKYIRGNLKGKPNILEYKTYEFSPKKDGYFLEIKVLKVNEQ